MTPLSIVLPLYNPHKDWPDTVLSNYREVEQYLGFQPILVIVQDGGESINPEVISQLSKKIPSLLFLQNPVNLGKGAALRKGFSACRSEKIIYTDIDFPYQTSSILKVWEALKNKDIVIGIKDEAYYKNVPKIRIFISKVLKKLIGILFNLPVTDTQCGLKGFNKKGKVIYSQTTINRYLCDLEFVYLSFKSRPKLRIQTVTISLKSGVIFSKMNPKILLIESLNLLKIILKR